MYTGGMNCSGTSFYEVLNTSALLALDVDIAFILALACHLAKRYICVWRNVSFLDIAASFFSFELHGSTVSDRIQSGE